MLQAEIAKEIEKHLRPLRMEANSIKTNHQQQIDEIRNKQNEVITTLETKLASNESVLLKIQEESRAQYFQQKSDMNELILILNKMNEDSHKRKKSSSPPPMNTDDH
jgi:hypothetical protein